MHQGSFSPGPNDKHKPSKTVLRHGDLGDTVRNLCYSNFIDDATASVIIEHILKHPEDYLEEGNSKTDRDVFSLEDTMFKQALQSASLEIRGNFRERIMALCEEQNLIKTEREYPALSRILSMDTLAYILAEYKGIEALKDANPCSTFLRNLLMVHPLVVGASNREKTARFITRKVILAARSDFYGQEGFEFGGYAKKYKQRVMGKKEKAVVRMKKTHRGGIKVRNRRLKKMRTER